MLAPAVQRLKSTFYGLHRWCKGQKVVFAICTIGATVPKWFFLFALVVQGPKSSFFCLHYRCKRQKEVFEVCTAGASVPKNTLTVTARYQRHSSGIRESILSSNSRYINISVTWSNSSLANCIAQTTAMDRIERLNPLVNCTICPSYVHFGGIMEQRIYALISLRP